MGKNELTSRTELSRCVCRGESLLSHAKKLKEKKRRVCVCVGGNKVNLTFLNCFTEVVQEVC